jgi:hypothetical protein
LGSGLPLPPAVDLHEDVSLYYIRTPRGLSLGDFGRISPDATAIYLSTLGLTSGWSSRV